MQLLLFFGRGRRIRTLNKGFGDPIKHNILCLVYHPKHYMLFSQLAHFYDTTALKAST